MRKQIYNLNCRKQTSGVPGAAPLAGFQGQRPWRGPGAAPLAGSRGSAPGGGGERDIFCLLSHSITCIIILII